MTSNKELIISFYQSFQKGDYKAMQACYSEEAVFSDEVFVNLNANEVKAMWEMLCFRGKDLNITFSNIVADEKSGTAEWNATYLFSKTNRKVNNRIRASFTFSNGKILRHTDHFNFYSWASQSLGVKGILLGWTSFLKNKVRKQARMNLLEYMSNKNDHFNAKFTGTTI